MKNKKIIIVVIAFIIIEILAFWKVEDIHNQEIDFLLEEKTYELEVKEKTVVSTYMLMTEMIFSHVINKPEVLKLFSQAYKADSLRQNEIRDSLYNLLQPVYEELTEKEIRQLQFHFPDNESFLRFRNPEKYGDNLIKYVEKGMNTPSELQPAAVPRGLRVQNSAQ